VSGGGAAFWAKEEYAKKKKDRIKETFNLFWFFITQMALA
jgi:hypothetical protein